MLYERRSQPVISERQWLLRMLRSILRAARVVAVSLAAGILGYHLLGGLGWIDSLLEASMILGGMGPVAPMQNDAIKIFASFYALFSGFVLLAAASIVVAPMLHRLMHHFHAEAQK